ncbi:MAG TPA: hypothetical protein VEH83_05905 [Gemmatimonadales bacterium]|nr:hypothetical protein [Gemmatimonadales bacterium]
MNRVQLLLMASVVVAAGCARGAAPAPAPALASPAAVRAPTPLRYTAGAGQYRFEAQTHVEQEMMGQTNAADVSVAARFSTALADTAGNLGIAVTVDSLSITASAGPGLDASALAAARGKVVRLVSSPAGQSIVAPKPDSAGDALLAVAQVLRDFLPALPPTAPTDGMTWTDTVTTDQPSGGLSVSVHAVRQHRVAGWEDHAGTRALHIASTSAYTVTGSGETGGQTIQIAGGGQRSEDAFVSAQGVYLGRTVSDSSLMNATLVSAGMVLPIRSKSHSTLTRLP